MPSLTACAGDVQGAAPAAAPAAPLLAGRDSHTRGTRSTRSTAERLKRSTAAMVKACWFMSWFRNPYDCSALRPAEASLPRASVAAGLEAERCSASWAWCRVARFSHSVVAIEVANAPAGVGMKVLGPEAEASWWCPGPG